MTEELLAVPWFPCCCCRYCPHCAGGFAPRQWQVEIEGIQPASPPDCGECQQLNGAYILDAAEPIITPIQPACAWSFTLPEPICNVVTVQLSVWPFVMPYGWSIALGLLDAAGLLVMGTRIDFPQPPQCLQLAELSLGPLSPWWPYMGLCDLSQSNARLTAVRRCNNAEPEA